MPAREACPGWSYNARPSTADAGLLALQHHQNVFTNLMALATRAARNNLANSLDRAYHS
jgi:hypothetical protein